MLRSAPELHRLKFRSSEWAPGPVGTGILIVSGSAEALDGITHQTIFQEFCHVRERDL